MLIAGKPSYSLPGAALPYCSKFHYYYCSEWYCHGGGDGEGDGNVDSDGVVLVGDHAVVIYTGINGQNIFIL